MDSGFDTLGICQRNLSERHRRRKSRSGHGRPRKRCQGPACRPRNERAGEQRLNDFLEAPDAEHASVRRQQVQLAGRRAHPASCSCPSRSDTRLRGSAPRTAEPLSGRRLTAARTAWRFPRDATSDAVSTIHRGAPFARQGNGHTAPRAPSRKISDISSASALGLSPAPGRYQKMDQFRRLRRANARYFGRMSVRIAPACCP